MVKALKMIKLFKFYMKKRVEFSVMLEENIHFVLKYHTLNFQVVILKHRMWDMLECQFTRIKKFEISRVQMYAEWDSRSNRHFRARVDVITDV